jgi:gamma-D-glutamyl-L-lysine dipeptidyl-peptidase
MQTLQICTNPFMNPFAICTAPAAPMRKEASHRSEMTNQLLFGETLQVLEEKEEWLRVKSLYDGYEGWVTHHLIEEVNEDVARLPLEYILHNNPLEHCIVGGSHIHLPLGAHLTGYNPQTGTLWKEHWEYVGSVKTVHANIQAEAVVRTAMQFLNAPYLWGGKTILGMDCSGLVQTVFKIYGIPLLRDAYQQATQGESVGHLSKARAGDVAFFHNKEGRIIHVGIVFRPGGIIHASGTVRIDDLDENGIVHSDSGKRTHELHSVRRFF